MNIRYLPIGSVIKLKNNNKSIMITGYYSVEYARDLEIYDYSGCAYPEGVMIKSSCCSFNQSDIKEVLFEGYKTNEYKTLTNGLNEIDEEIMTGGESQVVVLDELDSDKEKKKEDKSFKHYTFDENGILIK
ncbi:iS200 family transposase [Clostridium sp. CAG:609]|nr:iS200 family transposase [Clostridium sp. CAG:609]